MCGFCHYATLANSPVSAPAVRLQNGVVNFTDLSANAVHAKLNAVDMDRMRKLNAQAGVRRPVEAE
jgi:hypothetical protein